MSFCDCDQNTKYWSMTFTFILLSFQTGLSAYLIRDWRNLHFATSGLILPQIFLWPITYQSIRWLLVQKQWLQLEKVTRSCFKVNRTRPGQADSGNLNNPEFSGYVRWIDMVASPAIRIRVLLLICTWSILGLVHAGFGVTLANFPSDIFINFFATVAAEILGFILNLFLVDHLGRKTTLIIG